MKREVTTYLGTLLFCIGCLFSQLAAAHHSFATHYDPSKSMPLTGVVTKFDFRSPHSFVFMDAPDASGKMVSWEIELHSKPTLLRMGLNQQNLKPGDTITVSAWPNRVPNNPLVFGIGLVTQDGTRVGQQKAPDTFTSQFVDATGVNRLQGRWQVVVNGPPAGRKTPMQLSAAGEMAVANYDPKKSPANTCEIVNIPTTFHIPYVFDIRISDREVVIRHEIFNIERHVPFSENSIQSESTGMWGSARARIEGSELVIESSNYPASGWGLAQAGDANGVGADIPSSVEKKMEERYSVSEDGKTITISYKLEDPVYLAAAFTNSASATRVSDDYLMYDYQCEIDSAKRFSRDPE